MQQKNHPEIVKRRVGILLTNTGTPDAPTPHAVRRYLQEFLSDKRIITIPRFIWLPILHGFILTVRPSKSALLYKKIWTQEGAPLRSIMQKTQKSLQMLLNKERTKNIFHVEIGMNYGQPSISQGLDILRQQKIDLLFILPLFPQFSNSTTASTFDKVTSFIAKSTSLINMSFVRSYADNPAYINALVSSLSVRNQHPRRHLLISFHGMPERFVNRGDPYQSECEKTANLLTQQLQLTKHQWTLSYQSQFGYDKWLKPSTLSILSEFPKQGIRHIDVICPGFAIDCLETLEEVAIRGKEIFLQAGGESFQYIPALNDSLAHVHMLREIIQLRMNE